MTEGRIRVGVGGWTYEPWRGSFFPHDLPRKNELLYASRQLTALEINATYYRTQSAKSFAAWRDQTPDDFVFSVKASRYATNRKTLAEAGEAIERFLDSGITELGPKLGPILWQFAPTKTFAPEDLKRFLELLPSERQGILLRHVLDVRHQSFMHGEFVDLARQHRVAAVFTDSDDYPSFCEATSDFYYLRLMRSRQELDTGYSMAALDEWAKQAKQLARGRQPASLPRLASHYGVRPKGSARDVFIFFIDGAKERAPAAAQALLSRM